MAKETDRRALVVGFGSAGQRHARVLKAMGWRVSIVSRRPVEAAPLYSNLGDALAAEAADYVVVANETSHHVGSLAELSKLGFRGSVLVEKPLSADGGELPPHDFAGLYVAYQLRFLPVIERLRSLLAEMQPLCVDAHVGQHLETWRPDRRVQDSYSSRKADGGGVLRDLSHEIDLLLWLFGDWKRIASLGGHHNALDIETDDAWAILMELDGCPAATLRLNYLDCPARRSLTVTGTNGTVHADLLQHALQVGSKVEHLASESDEATRALHEAATGGDTTRICTAQQGQAVMRAILAIEAAAAEQSWVVP